MFRVDITDLNKLKLFLSLNDVVYVDATFDKDSAILVTNTSEIFAMLQLRCVSTEKERLQVRIPVKLLQNLASVGYFVLSTDEEQVHIEFFEATELQMEKICKVSFTRQDVWTSSYVHTLNTLKDSEPSDKFSIEELKNLIRIGNNVKSIINCNCGVASVNLSSSAKVFKKLSNVALNFSCTASGLLALSRVDSTVYLMKNYVCCLGDDLNVLCCMTRGSDNDDYAIMQEEKASFKCKTDFSNLIKFLAKIKIEATSIPIDLESQKACLTEMNRKYEIPVVSKDLQKSSKCKECLINVPKDILLTLPKLMNTVIFEVYNKSSFIQLDNKDISVVFRR